VEAVKEDKRAARLRKIAMRDRKSKRKKALLVKKFFNAAKKADRKRQSGG
jgi:hypothetical protein